MQEQRPQDLIYADVTVASKHKKKTTMNTKPSMTAVIQPDIPVEYSAINYNLCNKEVSNTKEHSSNHGMQ